MMFLMAKWRSEFFFLCVCLKSDFGSETKQHKSMIMKRQDLPTLLFHFRFHFTEKCQWIASHVSGRASCRSARLTESQKSVVNLRNIKLTFSFVSNVLLNPFCIRKNHKTIKLYDDRKDLKIYEISWLPEVKRPKICKTNSCPWILHASQPMFNFPFCCVMFS